MQAIDSLISSSISPFDKVQEGAPIKVSAITDHISEIEFHRLNGRSFDERGYPVSWRLEGTEVLYSPSPDGQEELIIRIGLSGAVIEHPVRILRALDESLHCVFAAYCIIPPFPETPAGHLCTRKLTAYGETLRDYLKMLTLSPVLRRDTLMKVFFCNGQDAEQTLREFKDKPRSAILKTCLNSVSRGLEVMKDVVSDMTTTGLSSSGLKQRNSSVSGIGVSEGRGNDQKQALVDNASMAVNVHKMPCLDTSLVATESTDVLHRELVLHIERITQVVRKCENALDALGQRIIAESEALEDFGVGVCMMSSVMSRGVWVCDSSKPIDAEPIVSSNICPGKTADVVQQNSIEQSLPVNKATALMLSPGKASLLGLLSGIITQNAAIRRSQGEVTLMRAKWNLTTAKSIIEQLQAFISTRQTKLHALAVCELDAKKHENDRNREKYLQFQAEARKNKKSLDKYTSNLLAQMNVADRCIALCVQALGVFFIMQGLEVTSTELERWEELVDLLREDMPNIYNLIKE